MMPSLRCSPAGSRLQSVLVAALSLLLTLSAQDEPGAAAGARRAPEPPVLDLTVPIHTAAPDGGVEYGVWAAGAGYKVSFHDGATYVPMLGVDHPHNLPWRWRTLSVRVGEVELVTQERQLQHTDWRAEYTRGGVVEAYDVRAEGLEQTFVIGQRPAVVGDLVVGGAITTALRAAATKAAHQALVFHDDAGKPILTYGAATAVDARGRRQPMTTEYADGQVRLRLDGAWLAAATFPIVVDPLLGPASPVLGSPRTEPDLYCETTTNGERVWVAYCIAASASDFDLRVQRWSLDGTVGSVPYVDLNSAWSTRRPRCGFDEFSGNGVIVFDRSFATGGRSVRCHRHHRSDASTTTTFDSIPATDNAWRADVGATRFSSPSLGEVLVVWQQEPNGGGAFVESTTSDIFGCKLNVYTGAASTPFPIANTAGTDYERPRTNGRTLYDEWSVAYQAYSTFGSNNAWDVVVRRVDGTGAVSPPYFVDAGSPDHKMAPQIDGVDDAFVVAFTTSTLSQQPGKPTGSNGHQLRTVRLTWDGSTMTAPYGTVVVQSYGDPRIELEGLGVDSSWTLYGLLFRSTVTENLYFRTLGYRGQQLQDETLVSATGTNTTVGGGVGGAIDGSFAIAYAINGNSPVSRITFDRYEFPAASPPVTTGNGCSSTPLVWQGRQQIGSESSFVYASGAAFGSIHFLLVALAPAQFVFQGDPLIADGCSLLVPIAGPDFIAMLPMGTNPLSLQAVRIPLPESLATTTLYFQDFHTNATMTQFVSTQRLEVQIVK